MKATIKPWHLHGLMAVLGFLLFNFDERLGSSYAILLFGYFLYWIYDKQHSIQIEKTRNRIKTVVLAIGGCLGFLFISTITLKIIDTIKPTLLNLSATGFTFTSYPSALDLFSQAQLIFEGNVFLTIVTYGFLIALIESIFFGGFLAEYLGDLFRIGKLNFLNAKTWALFFIIAGSFVFYHATSKGISNNSALIMVFVFMLVSLIILVLEGGQLMAMVLMHIISNTMAILTRFGYVGTTMPLIVIGIIGIVFLYLSKGVKLNFSTS